jgi:hypothetical protein
VNAAARREHTSLMDVQMQDRGSAGGGAMFRISETKGRSCTVVNIDGRLVGDYVRVAEDCCFRTLESARCVEVFLREVSAVDEAGRDLLCRLARRGVRLRASGLYLSNLVKAIQRSAANLGQANSTAETH